jgi:hypothetical protein
MLSPIYQNMVNLVVHLSIRRRSSEFINVAVWEHHTFGNNIFGCGKVYYSNSITITNFMQNIAHKHYKMCRTIKKHELQNVQISALKLQFFH